MPPLAEHRGPKTASVKRETSLPAARTQFLGLYLFDVESILFLVADLNNEMGRLAC